MDPGTPLPRSPHHRAFERSLASAHRPKNPRYGNGATGHPALKPDWEDPTFPTAKKKDNLAKKVPVDDAAARKGLELAGQIEDDEMRDVMARLIASVMRANEDREKADDE